MKNLKTLFSLLKIIKSIFIFNRLTATAYTGGHFGRGSGPIYLSGLQCTGNEGDLMDCRMDEQFLQNNCDHNRDAGVMCYSEYNQVLFNVKCRACYSILLLIRNTEFWFWFNKMIHLSFKAFTFRIKSSLQQEPDKYRN